MYDCSPIPVFSLLYSMILSLQECKKIRLNVCFEMAPFGAFEAFIKGGSPFAIVAELKVSPQG